MSFNGRDLYVYAPRFGQDGVATKIRLTFARVKTPPLPCYCVGQGVGRAQGAVPRDGYMAVAVNPSGYVANRAPQPQKAAP